MSADMLSGLVNSFGGPVLENLGAKFGVPKEVVKSATPVVISLVVAAVARMAKQPGGVDQISGLLNSASKQQGSADLASFVKDVDPAKSKDMLQALAGGNSLDNVMANLSGKTGIPADQIAAVLGTMAPAVLNQFNAMGKEKGLDTAGIAQAIGDAAANMPDGGIADYVLDNTPGISDDIKRGMKSIFG
jgi:hypothetical protein